MAVNSRMTVKEKQMKKNIFKLQLLIKWSYMMMSKNDLSTKLKNGVGN